MTDTQFEVGQIVVYHNFKPCCKVSGSSNSCTNQIFEILVISDTGPITVLLRCLTCRAKVYRYLTDCRISTNFIEIKI